MPARKKVNVTKAGASERRPSRPKLGQHFLVDSTLDSLWQEDLKEFGNHITYKKKAADWFVISGFKDGAEFYHKVHAKDDNCAELSFRYPHAKAKQYDPWVEKIARSFVPFLKGDYDRIIK